MTTYFITGTDTEVGKTYVSAQLLKHTQKIGLKSLGLKPIASDAKQTPQGLRNEDVLQHQANATIKLAYDEVNLLTEQEPIAPNIALNQKNIHMTPMMVADFCKKAIEKTKPDITLIEGAGGFLCPLNETDSFADIAKFIDCEIILVIPIKLGALNHSLLTAEAILARGYTFAGWIANTIGEPMSTHNEYMEYLTRFMPGPCLGIVENGELCCNEIFNGLRALQISSE